MTSFEVEAYARHNTPLDEIYSYSFARDYVEVVGDAGGDTLTYRFYNDGRITER
jgi:hypothetical protein